MCVGSNSHVDNNAVEEGYTHTKIILPTHVSNLRVTKIGIYSFRKNPSLVMIVIPKTIKVIEFDAIAYIPTLNEVIFEPDSKIETINQGFLFTTGIKYIVIPPTVKYLGRYTAGNTTIEDFVYCSNKEANFELLFFHGSQAYFPNRIHVKKSYLYSTFGTFTGELLKDNICETLFPIKKTCNVYRKCDNRTHILLLLIVISR